MINNESYKPWIEKYRPNNLNDVLLDETNKKIIYNIKKKEYLPNLLLFGPPGTGKTTTILNLINEFNINKNNIIHLNASDERGIDIIRNQIYNFIHFNQIYKSDIKIVILDEVDYMTKSAQNSLKQLIKRYPNVRFFLICNYISRIIKPLQNIFLKLYFYNNKRDEILQLLKNINEKEKLNLSEYSLDTLIKYYGTDIRSMINHLQLLQNLNNYKLEVISEELLNNFYKLIKNIKEKDIKKLNIFENKINNFLIKNSINFDILYKRIINDLIVEKELTLEIITNIKNLYLDNLNTDEHKVRFLIYQILLPINNL